MNILCREKRILALRCLVEGTSMRATCRIADVSRQTLHNLLVAAGGVCSDYQDEALRGLPCRTIQLDEIWQFVYAKAKNVERASRPPPVAGDVWTWVALCSDTKLVPSWRIGDRSAATGMDFVADLKSRLEHRVQVTSDGNNAYLEAVDAAFGQDLDYAMLVKRYQGDRYRGSDKLPLARNPDPAAISTSHVERQNLTMRMSMPRFTRKTNAFSKRVEMLHHATALHFFHYNFCRLHQTVKVAPAMEAGVTDRLFGIGDIVRMVEARDPKPGPRGPYKKCAAYSN